MDKEERRARKRLVTWFGSTLGSSLQALEAHRLREILPTFSGTFAVQIGSVGERDLLESSPTAVHVVVDPDDASGAAVRAAPEALPLDTRSIQVAVLPHTLDVSAHPHQALREIERVLAPEGYAIILGFNPVSLWGLSCLFCGRQGKQRRPWCKTAIGLSRLKDWLSLLDFEFVRGSMLYYRPPIGHPYVMDHLFFMEQVGDRWWPLGAAVYLVVARKRAPGLMPIMPVSRRRKLRPASRPVGLGHG